MSAVIRKRKYPGGRIKWQLDLGYVRQEDGKLKRIKHLYDSKDKAEGAKKLIDAKRQMHGDAAVSFPEEKRLRYAAIEKQLAEVGATIEQAGAYFLRHHRKLKPAIFLRQALDLCIAEKEQLGELKGRSSNTFKCSCLSFIESHPENTSQNTEPAQVQKWVLGNGWSPKTQRNYLGDLRALFGWLIGKKYASENPCVPINEEDAIKLARMEETEIAAFGFTHCERLLTGALVLTERKFNKSLRVWEDVHVFRPLIGYAALAMFGGIRPEEVQKTPRSHINLAGLAAVVSGKVAKTSKRRAVDLHENAAAWLALWMGLCPDETMIIPKNFVRLWKRLRQAVGLFDNWPHDVLRHTFASMHFAFYKDRARLQAEMGHSEDEDTLERHYKSVFTTDGDFITRAMAERFWNFYPPPRYPLAGEESKSILINDRQETSRASPFVDPAYTH